jgi:hypothetical protein
MGEMKNSYKILVIEPDRKRLLGRSRYKWKDNIRSLREIGWEGVDCMHLVHDKDQCWGLVNTVMNLLVP